MTPEKYSEIIYWKYAEDETLDNDQIKRCASIAADLLIKEADPIMKFYWEEVKAFIKKRGK